MSEPAKLGLSTYRWNNNFKSFVLLAGFPLLLALLLGGIFFVFGLVTAGPEGAAVDAFEIFGLDPVLGTATPVDLALSAIYAWWPIVFGIAGRRPDAGSAVATVTTIGYLGLLVGPPLVGGVAQATSLRVSFLALAVIAAAVAAATTRLRL